MAIYSILLHVWLKCIRLVNLKKPKTYKNIRLEKSAAMHVHFQDMVLKSNFSLNYFYGAAMGAY